MKRRIFLSSALIAVALSCHVLASAQVRPTPSRPVSGAGNPTSTGTATGIINSKLLIYAKNGLGTLNTNTGGEFAPQLVATATVNNEFSLQWSRSKPGKAEKGNLYIAPLNSTAWLGARSVTMPAESTSVNIQYTMPNLAPNSYVLMVIGETGNSGKVTINYTGKGDSQPGSIASGPTVPQSSATKSPLYITGVKFTPGSGAPGSGNYVKPKLTLTLRTTTKTTISKIEAEVWSEPFSNAELVTSTDAKNSPIKIFRGIWHALGGSYNIYADKDNTLTFALGRNSTNEINTEESGPGFYSPSDWGHAFAQTTTASFRWTVVSPSGNVNGSLDQSPKKAWQWGNQ